MSEMKLIMERWKKETSNLLNEEVFGAQAFVYHASKAPPDVFIPAIINDEYIT